jgi:hypothetical protein
MLYMTTVANELKSLSNDELVWFVTDAMQLFAEELEARGINDKLNQELASVQAIKQQLQQEPLRSFFQRIKAEETV